MYVNAIAPTKIETPTGKRLKKVNKLNGITLELSDSSTDRMTIRTAYQAATESPKVKTLKIGLTSLSFMCYETSLYS